VANQPIKILLLEDDANLGSLIEEHLCLQGYEVVRCVDGEEGLKRFAADQFDLCLVDVMMPKLDGFAFAENVRCRDVETPIMFLTARSLKEDKIKGFKIGCDDYLTKPFSIEELLLRIQAILKRTHNGTTEKALPTPFQLGKYVFDYRRQLLVLKSKQYKLTFKEAELLRLFCLNLNQTLEREVALKQIWGEDNYFNSRSMDVFISRLRKYLKDDPRVEILSVHGAGFRLVVD
jgi:two-component system, OmpR family, response regulator VicR